MTKQGNIRFRQGKAAFRAGHQFDLSETHEWKMGYLIAKRTADGWN